MGSGVKAAGDADTLARNQTHGRKIPARGRAQSLSKRDSQWFACDPFPCHSSSLHLPPHQIYPLHPRGVSCGPHRTCVASLSLKYLLRSMEMKASLRLMCRLKTLVSRRLSALPSGAQVPVTGSLQVSWFHSVAVAELYDRKQLREGMICFCLCFQVAIHS